MQVSTGPGLNTGGGVLGSGEFWNVPIRGSLSVPLCITWRVGRLIVTWRFMGPSKYNYKYHNWGYIIIVTLFITLVTKSHELLSKSPKPGPN